MLALSLSNVSNLGEAKLRLSESRAIPKPLIFGKAKLYFAFRSFIRNFAKEKNSCCDFIDSSDKKWKRQKSV